VIRPANGLIRRILQRGVDRGEFRSMDVDYSVFSLVAPMVFLMMMKHSMAACAPQEYPLDPLRYLDAQVENLLQGLCTRPAAGARP
jgi:TetR/AcrR family transcriptional regulator